MKGGIEPRGRIAYRSESHPGTIVEAVVVMFLFGERFTGNFLSVKVFLENSPSRRASRFGNQSKDEFVLFGEATDVVIGDSEMALIPSRVDVASFVGFQSRHASQTPRNKHIVGFGLRGSSTS